MIDTDNHPKKAFPAFLGLLSMRYCSVIPHEIANLNGVDFRKTQSEQGHLHLKIGKKM